MSWRGVLTVLAVGLALACGDSGPERSLETAVAEAARELAPLHPFAEPELLVVDSSVAANMDAAGLARALELPLGSFRWDCPTDDARDCVADPPVAAYLRVEDYAPDRDPDGRLTVTLGYYSLPRPFGQNNYMLAHELLLERTAAGWRVVETRESAEG